MVGRISRAGKLARNLHEHDRAALEPGRGRAAAVGAFPMRRRSAEDPLLATWSRRSNVSIADGTSSSLRSTSSRPTSRSNNTIAITFLKRNAWWARRGWRPVISRRCPASRPPTLLEEHRALPVPELADRRGRAILG